MKLVFRFSHWLCFNVAIKIKDITNFILFGDLKPCTRVIDSIVNPRYLKHKVKYFGGHMNMYGNLYFMAS